MAEWIVITPEGEETVEAEYLQIKNGCLLFWNTFDDIGRMSGYNKEEWKSYRLVNDD
jgi:hypothetical protein